MLEAIKSKSKQINGTHKKHTSEAITSNRPYSLTRNLHQELYCNAQSGGNGIKEQRWC
jgi:hypothetical protein